MDWTKLAEFNNAVSQTILDQDLLEPLLDQLGCTVKGCRGEHSFRGPCPIHLGDGDNLAVRAGGHSLPIRWACYSQHCEKKWRPSLVGLVRGILSTTAGRTVHPKVAADFLKKYLRDKPASTPRPVRGKIQPPPNLLQLTREQVRERLAIPSPYFVERGFSHAVLDRFDIGHSPRLGKSIVPLYADDGETCQGYMARSEWPTCRQCENCHPPGEECRYSQLRWTAMPGFPKGSHLYNFVAAARSTTWYVVLTEGPADVWRLAEAGLVGVALLGTDMTVEQAKKLAALEKAIFVAFDRDQAGMRATKIVEEKLSRMKVLTAKAEVPAKFKDIGEVPVEVVRGWLPPPVLP